MSEIHDARQAALWDKVDSLIEKGMQLAPTNLQLYIAVAMLYVAKAVLLAGEGIGAAIRETRGVP